MLDKETTETIARQRLVRYVSLVEKKSWKESVRQDLSNCKISTTRIAEELGLGDKGRDRLYGFLSRGTLNTDEVKMVEDYLIAKGFREPQGNQKAKYNRADELPQRSTPSLAEAIAAELEALALVLRSNDTPDELKGERFVSLIKSYAAGIDRHGKRLKEGISSGGGGHDQKS